VSSTTSTRTGIAAPSLVIALVIVLVIVLVSTVAA
jgi:hypothetical protein